ncbi:MAG: aminopeptidase [Ignavibacteria bacterium]
MKLTEEVLGFDKELIEGAHNAVKVCLNLRPEERITIITDNETLDIARSLVHEIMPIGSPYSMFVLEDYSPRPILEMPQEILDDLAKSQVSIFAANAHTGELKSRIQMTTVVNEHKIRHGHMVNISKKIMMEGMRADFYKVDELSQKILEKAKRAKSIRASSAAGTNIIAEFSPKLKWLKTSGLISPDKWGNLPGGEVFTSPKNLHGRFVVDGVVGDYLCKKYGDLKNTPLVIDIADSRITGLNCDNKELLDEFKNYVATDENSNRVGEFAIGTNIAINKVIGQILQDEKIPGIHIAFGHPYTEFTGADWISTTHIDCVGTNFNIWLDNEQVMEHGKFLI